MKKIIKNLYHKGRKEGYKGKKLDEYVKKAMSGISAVAEEIIAPIATEVKELKKKKK